MAKTTPFHPGTPVKGDSFVNREEERQELSSCFRSLNNVILISPRRWGKSSLIEQVKHDMRLEKDIVFVSIDAYFCTDENNFFHKYAQTVLKTLKGKLKGSITSVFKLLSLKHFQLSIDPNEGGGMGFSLQSNEQTLTLAQKEEILNLPERIAAKRKLRVVVCIDEFQETFNWKISNSNLHGLLRGVWQKHENVCYCLYGSHMSMMKSLFQDRSLPFYKFGRVIPLGKIDRDVFCNFIIDRVTKGGKSISYDTASLIVDTVDQNSNYVQELSAFCFESSKKEITADDVENAVNKLISRVSSTFKTIASPLPENQKKFLIALANSDRKEGLYSKEFIAKSGLEYSSKVDQVKNALIEKGLLFDNNGHLDFEDPIFKIWVLKNF